MKILCLADEECPALWEHYVPGRLDGYDLIISAGDLKAQYLSFIVTNAHCPVFYVHGNHDGSYEYRPPEGCDCIDDYVVEYNGLRILGLGGCSWYHPGPHQYTEQEMRQRIEKLRFAIWKAGGIDLVVTHAPPRGTGDMDDPAHWGFKAVRHLLHKYKPKHLIHGHVHLSYGADNTRVRQFEETTVINVCERYVLELPDREVKEKKKNRIIYHNRRRGDYV